MVLSYGTVNLEMSPEYYCCCHRVRTKVVKDKSGLAPFLHIN